MTKTKGKQLTAQKKEAPSKSAKKPPTGKAGSTAQVAPTIKADEIESKPVRNYKTHTKRLIARKFSDIMESMAVKSKEGSLAHVKFLFEIGGVKEDLARMGRGKAEPSLADLLMSEVRRQQSERGAAEHPLKTSEESGLLPIDDTDQGVAN